MTYEWIIQIISDNWPMFLRGAAVTLYISLIGTIIGAVIGLLAGVVRTIPLPERGMKRWLLKLVNGLLTVYIECFRGTPMIVQAMAIFTGRPCCSTTIWTGRSRRFSSSPSIRGLIWPRSCAAASIRWTKDSSKRLMRSG
ncbi:hypothetical protein HMSSN139_29590 [Paenibacillus sp. HMSSN-139]|nr:hypothetical protein HMSSN139_29590 [Paenibacillus sp. HMSSN-139]